VETEIAKIVTVEDKSELSAMLQPMEEAILSFEVPGRIILDKKENDNVDSGDIIAKIDSSQYQINTGIADASLNQAGANLSQTLNGAREQEKESVKATYDKASAVYEKSLIDCKRMETLFKEGAISKSDYENAQTSLVVSQNDMTAAKAVYDMALEGARDEVKQMAQEGYKLAKGNSDLAMLALGKTQLKAPFKGTILSGDEPYIFINHEGKAVKKVVTLGELKGNKLQILTGLDEGSEVIVSGVGELFEGASVKVSSGVEQ